MKGKSADAHCMKRKSVGAPCLRRKRDCLLRGKKGKERTSYSIPFIQGNFRDWGIGLTHGSTWRDFSVTHVCLKWFQIMKSSINPKLKIKNVSVKQETYPWFMQSVWAWVTLIVKYQWLSVSLLTFGWILISVHLVHIQFKTISIQLNLNKEWGLISCACKSNWSVSLKLDLKRALMITWEYF